MEQLGSYRLRKRLAVGGMGEVYLGEKLGPEGFVKPVVLKCVLPQLASDRAFLNLFLDEARLAALLNHPNIAQIYDFGFVEDVYYIAMEYVPGYTLDEIRRKLSSIGQYLPLQHLACIASQACQGLHYAHTLTDGRGEGLGLVHRDVSPHNLIISLDGSVKLLDFGIAKARDGISRVQAKGAVGKFGYMSPEQAAGGAVDARSDLFSLGICMWELCTNARLHDPELANPPDYNQSLSIRSVGAYRPEISPLFAQILSSALSVEARLRFPSAREMHLALEKFQASMSHFAGQTALSNYLEDLVEGRFEDDSSTPLVRMGPADVAGPVASAPVSSAFNGPAAVQAPMSSVPVDATRVYDEVFGGREGGSREADPAPVESSDPPMPISNDISGEFGLPQARLLDFEPEGPEVELDRPPQPKPPSTPPKKATPGKSLQWAQTTTATGKVVTASLPPPERKWLRWVVAAVFLAVGATAVYQRDRIQQIIFPPPEPVEESMYRVESEPPGASVRIDGVLHSSKTPVELSLVVDRTHSIEVSMQGRATKRAEVKAASGPLVRPLRFTLEPAGRLRVETEPSGASVLVEGRPARGITPLELDDVPLGRRFEVEVRLEGHGAKSKQVRLQQDRSRTVRFRLEQD